MTRIQKLIFLGFLFLVAAFVYLEANKPEPVNWFPSYHNQDKIPLGTYVLYDLMKDVFDENLQEISRPPYEVLQDSTLVGTYFFVNNYIPIDKIESEKILDWVSKGNNVFISAHSVGFEIMDTLKLETDRTVLFNKIETQPLLNLINKNLAAEEPYHIDRNLDVRYFEKIDTISQTVLGVTQAYNDTLKITQPLINFIKSPFGNGNIFIHNQPEVFSNYFLLQQNNSKYTEGVLSYLNNGQTIFWDKHYKSGKRVNISPLHLLFSNKYLKWAYYFVLVGAFLFVLFEGKRKQRSIAIVNPPSNKTFEYTQTIAGMYLNKKEHHEIAKKQIILFFEFIRTRLRVPTENMNSRFFTAVAARSGNTLEDTKDLFTFIEKVQHQEHTSQEELLKLNREITQYKNKIDGKS